MFMRLDPINLVDHFFVLNANNYDVDRFLRIDEFSHAISEIEFGCGMNRASRSKLVNCNL